MVAKQGHVTDLPDLLHWFNVDVPVRLSEQKGRVVLLNFATYCSLQCLHVIAGLDHLAKKYPNELVIVGIHGPRFPAERSVEHVRNALVRHRVRHPVIHDPEYRLWRRFGIRSGPALGVIDTRGNVVGTVSGAGSREKLERIIGSLLARAARTGREPGVPYVLKPPSEPEGSLAFPDKLVATETRIYIADSGHHRILAASPRGLILQQYGDGNPGFMDGNGFSAAFNGPQSMVLADEFLYVADTGNHAIRRINIRSEEVVTLAGTGAMGVRPTGDYFSELREVNLNTPTGLAHKASILYIAMSGMHQIWSLSLATHTLEIFAGSGEEGLEDGASWNACFAQPSALSVVGHTLYVVDAGSSAIRAIDLKTRQVTTLAGRGLFDFGDTDGIGVAASFQHPLDIKADPTQKSIWIADTYNNKIRKIGIDTKRVSSYPLRHPLSEPCGLAFNGHTLYIANTNRHEIVRVNLRSGSSESLNVSDKYIGL
jgi:DNA-binding beta-propeller fold protein YncE